MICHKAKPVAGKSGTEAEDGSKGLGGSGVSGVVDEPPGKDVEVGVTVLDGELEVVEVSGTDELVSTTLVLPDNTVLVVFCGCVVEDVDVVVTPSVFVVGWLVVLVDVVVASVVVVTHFFSLHRST